MREQGSTARRRVLVVATLAGVLALAVPAAADQQIVAAQSRRYVNPSVTIQQGEKLTFRNDDIVQHDVTSVDSKDAKPLFSTPLVDPKGEAVVDGADALKPGSYQFLCSIHANMQGTLTVTPGPSSGGGPAALKPASASLSAVRHAKALKVAVTGEPGAEAIVAAQAKIRGKTVKLAKTRVTLTSGEAERVTLTLSDKGRRALKGLSKVTVRFKVTVLAAAGSSSARASRTYR